DPFGGFVAAWVSLFALQGPGQDGDSTGVFARRLDANGSPDGLEFQINDYTQGAQGWLTWPIGLVLTKVGVIATWQSEGQDSFNTGVFARRLRVDPLEGPVCGDAYAQDLELDINDAVAVLRSALGQRPCLKCLCDTDGSGSVTLSDALLVVKTVVGTG